MVKNISEDELTEILQDLTIITDSREQKNEHILAWLDNNKIPRVQRKLFLGDYSAQLGDGTLERTVVIERKHGLEELCLNFTSDKARFERELLKAHMLGVKVHLIIEGASWQEVFEHGYRSLLPPKVLVGELIKLTVNYGITPVFCRPEETPRLIYQILYQEARRDLLNGGGTGN